MLQWPSSASLRRKKSLERWSWAFLLWSQLTACTEPCTCGPQENLVCYWLYNNKCNVWCLLTREITGRVPSRTHHTSHVTWINDNDGDATFVVDRSACYTMPRSIKQTPRAPPSCGLRSRRTVLVPATVEDAVDPVSPGTTGNRDGRFMGMGSIQRRYTHVMSISLSIAPSPSARLTWGSV